MESETQLQPAMPRALTPSERGIAIASGVFMLILSLLSLAAAITLAVPFFRLIEGLSK